MEKQELIGCDGDVEQSRQYKHAIALPLYNKILFWYGLNLQGIMALHQKVFLQIVLPDSPNRFWDLSGFSRTLQALSWGQSGFSRIFQAFLIQSPLLD